MDYTNVLFFFGWLSLTPEKSYLILLSDGCKFCQVAFSDSNKTKYERVNSQHYA